MLLLTDDLNRSAALQRAFEAVQACETLALDDALTRPASHTMIACCAALDPGNSTKLQAALSHHRTDPRIPVLFLTSDASTYAAMQATTLGATATLPHDTPTEELISIVKRLMMTSPEATPVDTTKSRAEASIREIGNSLWTILAAARQRRAIPLATLETGADALLLSIRKTEIRLWLGIVRRYDDVTFQHSLLVAGLVAGFAARLGLAAPSQRLLAQAALIHDIGKAVIPQHILNKPGALSPAETAVMRTHAAEGHAMLVGQKGLAAAVPGIVRHHHEYLDGSGYPDRLRSGQISDLVRLTTICDIFAALTERRSYKPPMPPRHAYGILQEMGGKLDESLLKAFAGYVDAM